MQAAESCVPFAFIGTPAVAIVVALIVALVVTVIVAPSAWAGTSYERAQVVNVEPIYETVSQNIPIEQCQEERVAYQTGTARRSPTAPILGAIIGGAIGNAVGHSNTNKKVGTVVGAVLGGSIGADIAYHNRRYDHGEVRYRMEEVCHTTYEIREEERLAAYNVSYVYGGSTYSTRMQRHPGDSIRVRVRVSPAQ
jgi:uncharacterized protein YcfJ